MSVMDRMIRDAGAGKRVSMQELKRRSQI